MFLFENSGLFLSIKTQNSTHHHLKKQPTEREQRETWVRGCPHVFLCWDKSLRTEVIAVSLQASHWPLRGVFLCHMCESVCVLLEKGWILGLYRRPLICMWVDPWPQPHTAVHTSTPGPSPLVTTLNACIPAACSHKGQRSSRQSCLSGHHQLWHSSFHLLIQRMSVLRACWWPWINAEQHKHPQWVRKFHNVNFI